MADYLRDKYFPGANIPADFEATDKTREGKNFSLSERREAYEVCKERGHVSSDRVLTSNPPWLVCKFCGTHYRFETTVVESNVPK